MLNIKCFPVGILETNCYLIEDTATGYLAVVDPGAKSPAMDKIIDNATENSLKYILLTHGHFDHIGNSENLRNEYGAKIVICEKEKDFLSKNTLNLSTSIMNTPLKPFKADVLLNENDTIMLGNSKITLIETPGHTYGGACYIIDNNLFCGDTLFKESMGRTDFPTGNYTNLIQSLQKLKSLNGNYNVFPGHGELSNLEYERQHNMCME